MTALPESVTGRHISYVGDETYLFPHSILRERGLRPEAPPHRAPRSTRAAP